jgi:hypothetical protein
MDEPEFDSARTTGCTELFVLVNSNNTIDVAKLGVQGIGLSSIALASRAP